MRNSSSLDWLRFMHTPNDYRVSHAIFYILKPIYVLLPRIMEHSKGIFLLSETSHQQLKMYFELKTALFKL